MMFFMELEIRDLSASGEGVADADGLVLFVDGALPGEVVEARMTQKKKRYAKAQVVKVLKSSEKRIQPICPYFGRCGGCQIMHLEYGDQLKFKQKKVQEALKRIGKMDVKIFPTIPSKREFHYRNKVHLHGGGFHKRHSHEVISIDACKIHNEVGERALDLVRDASDAVLKTSFANEEVLVVVDGKVQGIFDRDGKMREGETIVENLGGLEFEIGAKDFFQVNTKQALVLYEKVLEFAELKTSDRVVDAYCGVGTLSLFASKFVHHVRGIESGHCAIESAKRNALRNSVENVSFECALVQDCELDADVVFINPPRGGVDPKVLETLMKNPVKRLVYISCDPATLARDLKVLSECYSVDAVQPVDMFPQTVHVETVAKLTMS